MAKSKRCTNKPLADRVKARDDYHCIKCGGHRSLEAHHIIPLYRGGTDVESNLITLCHSCHKFAPNDPVAFFKYCSVHLPHTLAKTRDFTKTILQILRYKHMSILADPSNDAMVKLEAIIDKQVADMWRAMYSDDIDEFAKLMRGIAHRDTDESEETT